LRYLSLLILATLLATPASAADLLIIQSHRNQQFDETVRQIEKSCGKKSLTYIMGDYAEFDLGRIVREERPRLVVAVGDKPLHESLKLRTTPVLYTMALTAEENRPRNNIAGISMHVAPENYLALLRKLGLRRAGVVYNKKTSGAYMERARKHAAEYGVELIAMQIQSPREVAAALNGLKERRIDSIWMIPDTTAVTAETVDAYFLMAQTHNIPLISFSRSYLQKGALAVLEASRRKMTGQLCADIARLLGGADPADLPPEDISEATLYTNDFIARKLNVTFSGAKQLFSPARE
jgi:putative ABC transport system substrate-binding protein